VAESRNRLPGPINSPTGSDAPAEARCSAAMAAETDQGHQFQQGAAHGEPWHVAGSEWRSPLAARPVPTGSIGSRLSSRLGPSLGRSESGFCEGLDQVSAMPPASQGTKGGTSHTPCPCPAGAGSPELAGTGYPSRAPAGRAEPAGKARLDYPAGSAWTHRIRGELAIAGIPEAASLFGLIGCGVIWVITRRDGRNPPELAEKLG
jgi:hypothetical protein